MARKRKYSEVQPVGKPSKISPRRIETILTQIALGLSQATASRMAGISPQTLIQWKHRGEDEIARIGIDESEPEVIITNWLDSFPDDFSQKNEMWTTEPPEQFDPREWIYALFVMRFERAYAEAESSALGRIRAAGRSGTWQADAWFLERTRHDKYGRRDTIKHEGSEDAPLQVHASYTVEGLIERLSVLKELRAGDSANDDRTIDAEVVED